MSPEAPQTLGVLHHPKIPHSLKLAEEIAVYCELHGRCAWVGSSWDTEAVCERLSHLDALVTLGGDGTILRTARICAAERKPIMAVNLGRVGFLAEIQPDQWQQGIARLLDGDYWLEKRMMLETDHCREETVLQTYQSLNEVVVGRGRLARVIRIDARVDGARVAQYVADGLIAATPTGSTAYAFAAGGPIMPPTLRNILLVPIAPMFGLARPVVLSEGTHVTLTVETDHEAMLTVDGQFEVSLDSGDQVHVRASEHGASFVRLKPPSYFYESLSERLRIR